MSEQRKAIIWGITDIARSITVKSIKCGMIIAGICFLAGCGVKEVRSGKGDVSVSSSGSIYTFNVKYVGRDYYKTRPTFEFISTDGVNVVKEKIVASNDKKSYEIFMPGKKGNKYSSFNGFLKNNKIEDSSIISGLKAGNLHAKYFTVRPFSMKSVKGINKVIGKFKITGSGKSWVIVPGGTTYRIK